VGQHHAPSKTDDPRPLRHQPRASDGSRCRTAQSPVASGDTKFTFTTDAIGADELAHTKHPQVYDPSLPYSVETGTMTEVPGNCFMTMPKNGPKVQPRAGCAVEYKDGPSMATGTIYRHSLPVQGYHLRNGAAMRGVPSRRVDDLAVPVSHPWPCSCPRQERGGELAAAAAASAGIRGK